MAQGRKYMPDSFRIKVLELLDEGVETSLEVADALDVPRLVASNCLRNMVRDQVLYRKKEPFHKPGWNQPLTRYGLRPDSQAAVEK